MNGRKSKEKRKKVDALKKYLAEADELALKEWQDAEPKKWRLFRHWVWKKMKPTPTEYTPRHMKKSIK